MKTNVQWWKLGLVTPLLAACGGGGGGGFAQETRPLEAVCVEQREAVPAGGWLCGEDRTVECNTHEGAHPDYIHVVAPPTDADGAGAPACPSEPFEVSDPGPYRPGTYEIAVYDPHAGPTEPAVCTSTLTVVDTRPPEATPHVVHLWPPNHKLHPLDIADCVTVEDACDRDVQVFFTWGASNEVENGTGDGNHAPDIVGLGCESVQVRAERSGNGGGRVYTFGWKAVDDAGNEAEGTCRVVVAHDQGNGRNDPAPGEAYRVEAPADCAPPPTEAGDPQPGDDETGGNEPGGNEPGDDETGGNEPGDPQPGDDEPGDPQPGDDEPRNNEPGTF